MELGTFTNVSREEYESWDALNYSTMKLFERSAAHAREAMVHPKEETPAMRLGSAVHSAVLVPRLFKEEYGRAPVADRRTKAGKSAWAEWEAENSGKIALSPSEMEQLNSMSKAVHSHPIASQVLSKAATEVSVLWKDLNSGVLCKARVDAVSTYADWTVVCDLKTSQNAEPGAFQRSIGTYRYDMQAHWYLRALSAMSSNVERRFWFIVVENSAPFGVSICEPSFATLQLGKRACDKFLKEYKKCIDTGEWPSYSSGVEKVDAPNWMFYKEDEEEGW